MNMIQFERKNKVAKISLSRPAALNTLNLDMIEQLNRLLDQIETENKIEWILLDGTGPKAFCSGGDVKEVILQLRANNKKYGLDFFQKEYALNLKLAHYRKKPIIGFAHGYTMGGGLGLLLPSAIRICDPKTLFSMPEAIIGFFADVGGSYYLSKKYPKLGLFSALTSATLNAADAQHLGLIDYQIEKEKQNELESLQFNEIAPWLTKNALTNQTTSPLKEHQSLIENIFPASWPSDPTVCFEMIKNLNQDSFLKKCAENFQASSPTSTHLIYSQFKKVTEKKLSLTQTLEFDFILSQFFMNHPDFSEGVRALLIDKDKKPQFQPVDLNTFEKFF